MGAARTALTPFDAVLMSLASPGSALTADITEDSAASKILVARNDGVSSGTVRAMATDADLDKGLYDKPKAVPADTQIGRDPTKRVTQQEYDRMKEEQNRKAMENYLRNKGKK